MSDEVTIGRRFTVVIPKSVRRSVGLKEGQHALVRAEAGRTIMETLPSDPYGTLADAIGNIDYSEAKHERKAEKWLKKNARPGHTASSLRLNDQILSDDTSFDPIPNLARTRLT